MYEIFDKLREELDEYPHSNYEDDYGKGFSAAINIALNLIDQLEDEYNESVHIYETVRTNRLECEVPSDYFNDIKEVRVIDEWTEEERIFIEKEKEND